VISRLGEVNRGGVGLLVAQITHQQVMRDRGEERR